MIYFELLLLAFLVFCAIGTVCTKNLLASVVVFMGFSSIMAVIWLLLQSPDLAITQAAVGAGIDTILFVVTLKRIHALKGTEKDEK